MNPPRLTFRLLNPPTELVTGHRDDLHGELTNLSGQPWTATYPDLFLGLLLTGGPDGQVANGGAWTTLVGRQVDLPASGQVQLPGVVEARGPYTGANAPLLRPGPYWLLVRLRLRLDRPGFPSDGLTTSVASAPAPLGITTRHWS